MEQAELIAKSQELVSNAFERYSIGAEQQANEYLVRLRELLEEQPELEAGGG